MVALAVRLFDANARIRVITHTADENLAKACARIPPELRYYDIKSRYYNPPQTAKVKFPTAGQLTWSEPDEHSKEQILSTATNQPENRMH